MPEVLAGDPVPISDRRDLFDPPTFSNEELVWLLDHLGDPPVVAFRQPLPPQVNSKAVRPVIERVYELVEVEKHEGEKWLGIEAIKSAIKTYQIKYAEWASAHRRSPRGVPRFPTLFRKDTARRMFRGGIGSDAGQVRSYEDGNGNRQYFAVALNTPADEVSTLGDRPEVPTLPETAARKLVHNDDFGVVTCPVCKHTQNYDPDSASGRNIARARMATHLKTAMNEPDWHRAVYTEEFA